MRIKVWRDCRTCGVDQHSKLKALLNFDDTPLKTSNRQLEFACELRSFYGKLANGINFLDSFLLSIYKYVNCQGYRLKMFYGYGSS